MLRWSEAVRWAARQLGVARPDSAGAWLWRLIIRPAPPAEHAHEQWIERRLRVWRDGLALALGVHRLDDGWQWMVRLLVLPPAAAARGRFDGVRAAARTAVRITARLADAVYWLTDAVVSACVRRWPGLAAPRLAERLDRAATSRWLGQPVVVWPLLALCVGGLWLAVTTPLPWQGQLLFALALWGLALFTRRLPGRVPTYLLIALSLVATVRYGWWRVTQTMDLTPGWEMFLGTGLLLAEAYAWLVMLLGFMQTAWPLERRPVPLPVQVEQWPSVDVFIPTYNEPLSVLQPTVLAALGLDWPADRLRVYILDDGRREEIRQFAERAGVGYMTRPDNAHAKAGNLNHALRHTAGDFVAIFDCDHLPVRSFLQTTMGEMLRDPRCAMIQTPHHFFSPDPFERNLDTFRRVPNEGALFYGLIQDGNDFWNATFFCGSCAVIRREPLMEVGGIAVETVTEDAHTALKMHRRGWRTAYLNIPQAAGLATESLSGHVGQRIRWARGMAQIFRIDNPLLGKGLSWMQRVCYSNAMLHFFYGIPRLVFLTAPLAYLFFHLNIIHAEAAVIALYALPHVILPNIANAHIQGAHRHTFWSEVYETVLAWYITLPTTIAFINPKLGKFNVTAKGGLVESTHFDWSISRPYLGLVALNFLGVAAGVMSLFTWNREEAGTVLLNLMWAGFNLLLLGAAIGVARERRQVRVAHRVQARLPVTLLLSDGSTLRCHTEDYSMGGLGIRLPSPLTMAPGSRLQVLMRSGSREHVFTGRVASLRGLRLGVRMDGLSLQAQQSYIQCTFGRADAWTTWSDRYQSDRPLQGLQEIASLGIAGYRSLWRSNIDALRHRWQSWRADLSDSNERFGQASA